MINKKKSNVFLLVILLLFLVSSIYLYQSYLLKKKSLTLLKDYQAKIVSYSKWGYKTEPFEKLQEKLITETETISVFIFPFKKTYVQNKNSNVINLVQTGYATEVTNMKEHIQSRLAYLRDRVKTNEIIPQKNKQAYFDAFEVVAGSVFERNIDIVGLKEALLTLQQKDNAITAEIETVRKESLRNELESYKTSCNELLFYFTYKNSLENIKIAQDCIAAADTLLGTNYEVNGADYLETLSRERVFTLTQKATHAKQQLMQDEEYTLAAKKREEEKLTVVPPAPRQEGKVVLVNLALQRLYAYENGATLFSTAVPITTGKQGFETVTGEFVIYLKEQQHKMVSPFPGIYYDDVVNYWMPFYLGYGLHDAPWRSIYGTQDYPVVGSHGCVNIPLKDTIVLYNWAEVGTRVIVL